jgi:hypothetical protein
MNFRLPAFALLTLLLALSQAYGQASGASYQQSIRQAPTALNINTSSSVVGLESPPTLSAVVAFPNSGQTTGNVKFTVQNGSTVVATGTAPVNLTGMATWTPSLPTGTFSIFAIYSGDSNLLGSTSPAISQTVLGPPDFSFSASPFSVAQGQSAAAPISVTSINGFHGTIAFSCASQSSEVDCGLLPSALSVPAPVAQTTPSASAGNVALNVTTFSTTVEHAGMFGAYLLCLLSSTRRKRRVLLAAATLCLLLTGCGTGTRYVQQDGTPKGTYSITVTGTSGKLSHTQTVLVTVR